MIWFLDILGSYMFILDLSHTVYFRTCYSTSGEPLRGGGHLGPLAKNKTNGITPRITRSLIIVS